MAEIVHCLQCDTVFEENPEFVEVCPCCDNDDPMSTVYIVTKENDTDA